MRQPFHELCQVCLGRFCHEVSGQVVPNCRASGSQVCMLCRLPGESPQSSGVFTVQDCGHRNEAFKF